MVVKLIIIFLAGGWFGANLSYHFFYSPKARVKRLWGKIYRLSSIFKNPEVLPAYVTYPTELAKNKIGKEINSLLDNEFDPEEDKEYIETNKYTDPYIEHDEYVKKQVGRLLIQREDWEKIEKLLNK